MPKKRLLWHLYAPYLLITLISLFAITWYASRSIRQSYIERTAADLEAEAYLVEKLVSHRLTPENAPLVDALCEELGRKTDSRITVVLSSGTVVGDSEEDPARMDNHADRPEIVEALAGRTGVSSRYSYTLERTMMYVAIPVMDGGAIAGVVRTSIPITHIDRAVRTIYVEIALGGLLIAVVAGVISLTVAGRISRPLEEMRQVAERIARGDLDAKLHVSGSHEVSALAEAMNQMAAQLDDRIRTVVRQRNEQEAVLSSMVEGVLAVDAEDRLINMNQAAARLIGVDPVEVQGRGIHEIVRNTDLQRFVRRALASREPVEGEIILQSGEERFLQAQGTTLRDANGRCIGAVIVLSDATNIRRLENVRREFVANVSHELKTPITSIKGFVETLLDGAMRNPEDAQRFLDIIAKQADRLNAIIEDLLSLAKIEQDAEEEAIALQEGQLRGVLQSALQVCESRASEKKITVDLACDDTVLANVNSQLLEQAVVNLIDNAVKYSESGSRIEVSAAQVNSEVVITVRDEGCGIEEEHLSRLFERFYRVDKARSRKLGGTGLGLAIVKHITQAHGGRVTVESTPGKGSIFRIYLPKR